MMSGTAILFIPNQMKMSIAQIWDIYILYISLRCLFEQICDHTVRVHAGCALHVTHHTMHIDKISTA